MNWTGGELTKAAPSKPRALVQRQKAHFAKARATAHRSADNAIRQSDQDPSCTRSNLHSGAYGGHEHGMSAPSSRREAGHESTGWTRPKSSDRRIHAAPTLQRPQQRKHDSTLDDEEQRLLWKRQQLLSRTDWLGLGATKPLRLQFPETSDRGRIGKRRPVKACDNTGVIERRTVWRPIQDPLAKDPRFRRGSLPAAEDVRIKIGTAALASQTQPSVPSRQYASRYSDRGSPDMDSLSEEPMLLDSQDDMFERPAYQSPFAYNERQASPMPIEPAYLFAANQQSPIVFAPQVATMRALQAFGRSSPQSQQSSVCEQALHILKSPSRAFMPRKFSRKHDNFGPSHITEDVVKAQGKTNAVAKTVVENDGVQEREYERCWKGLVGVSTSSRQASSLNVLTSAWQPSSTPCRRANPVTDISKHQKPQNMVQRQHRSDKANAEQEESWRQFIVGDQRSQSSDSPRPVMCIRHDIVDGSSQHLAPVLSDSSGMPHSIGATHGGSRADLVSSSHAGDADTTMALASSSCLSSG